MDLLDTAYANLPATTPKSGDVLDTAYANLPAQSPSGSTFNPPPNPTEGNSFLKNLVIGAGKGFYDLGTGTKARLDDAGAYLGIPGATAAQQQDTANADEHKKLDAPLMSTVGGKVGNFVAQAAPAVVAGMVPGVQGLAASVLTGAALGGVQPTGTGDSAVSNSIMGGIGGGVGYGSAKLLGSAFGGIKSLAEPFYDNGQNLIIGRALNSAAGSSSDAAAARLALANAKPIVPGSFPTVGQAAGNPSLAAMERTLSQTSPTAVNAMAQRVAQQNAARSAALSDLAGTDGARDYFAADRTATGNGLYKDAFNSGIDPNIVAQPEVQQTIQKLLNRPSIQKAQIEAKSLAAENDMPLDDSSSLPGLHYTKLAIGEQINAAKQSGASTLAEYLTNTHNDLNNLMTTISPKYAEARDTFAAMSKPINQMDVGQALADKVNSLTGNLQPNAYAKAISDATAAKATGFPGATLENTMSPDQMATINAVKQDLLRAHFAQTAGKAGSDTAQKLAYSNMVDSAGIPTWLQNTPLAQATGNILAKPAQMLYGDANKALGEKMAASLMNPADAATYMNQAAMSPAGGSGITGIIARAMNASAPYIGNVGAKYLGQPATALAARGATHLIQGDQGDANP